MLRSIATFKGVVAFLLSVIVKIAVILSVVYVIQSLMALLLSYPIHIIETEELRALFGAILFVVLALELNHLLVQYASSDRIEINTVLAVLIIAFARKLLLLKLEEADMLILLGGSCVLLATGVTYWMIAKTHSEWRILKKSSEREPSVLHNSHGGAPIP